MSRQLLELFGSSQRSLLQPTISSTRISFTSVPNVFQPIRFATNTAGGPSSRDNLLKGVEDQSKYKADKLKRFVLRKTRIGYKTKAPEVQDKDPASNPPKKKAAYLPDEVVDSRIQKEKRGWARMDDLGIMTNPTQEDEEEEGTRLKVFEMQIPQPRERNVIELDAAEVGGNPENAWESRATGGRKAASANVRVRPAKVEGHGIVTVNNRKFCNYFPFESYRENILRPLVATETLGKYDIVAQTNGGGNTGQAEAIRLAIARALQNIDPNNRPVLKKAGLLERDQRAVERKKPGREKARKRYQWVKR